MTKDLRKPEVALSSDFAKNLDSIHDEIVIVEANEKDVLRLPFCSTIGQ